MTVLPPGRVAPAGPVSSRHIGRENRLNGSNAALGEHEGETVT
jgi:hypothetical protein